MGDFVYTWQHLPQHLNPVLFHLGPLRVQWYGLMYIVAFTVVYFLARARTRTEQRFADYDDEFLKNILTYGFIGVLIGGRIGYVLFYNLPYYLNHPLEIILPFSLDGGFRFTGISGMSYHGGVTGAILGSLLFARKYKFDFWNLCDLFVPVTPLGYTFGRLGNFINGELWGRVTDQPIGMYFPLAPDSGSPRHPSQLYEAFFEGVFLYLVLLAVRKSGLRVPKGGMAGLYIFGYGFIRFWLEFYRQPDAHLGFVFLNRYSMGQVLCAAMMVIGIGLFVWRLIADKPAEATPAGPQSV